MPANQMIALPVDQALPRAQVPTLTATDLQNAILAALVSGSRIAALYGERQDGIVRVTAILADPARGKVLVGQTQVDKSWLSMATRCPAAALFEREMAEQVGLVISGHPWLKPVRKPPLDRTATPGSYPFYRVSGNEVHEVAVGPVHAGVIEPGHFRFQCHGETVIHLEIVHGYQHRGVEAALLGGPHRRSVHLLETACGDTTIGHTTAYCRALEALSGNRVPPRAVALRAVALELERLANHIGDIGAMSGDVGYLPTAAFLGRLRGDVLNLTAGMCGSRFGRGFVRPGCVVFDLDRALACDLAEQLAHTRPLSPSPRPRDKDETRQPSYTLTKQRTRHNQHDVG